MGDIVDQQVLKDKNVSWLSSVRGTRLGSTVCLGLSKGAQRFQCSVTFSFQDLVFSVQSSLELAA